MLMDRSGVSSGTLTSIRTREISSTVSREETRKSFLVVRIFQSQANIRPSCSRIVRRCRGPPSGPSLFSARDPRYWYRAEYRNFAVSRTLTIVYFLASPGISTQEGLN